MDKNFPIPIQIINPILIFANQLLSHILYQFLVKDRKFTLNFWRQNFNNKDDIFTYKLGQKVEEFLISQAER